MTQAAVETNIRVNGETEPLLVATLAALLEEKAVDIGQRGIAVALDGDVVPRSEWPATRVADGQQVEVLRAVQGG